MNKESADFITNYIPLRDLYFLSKDVPNEKRKNWLYVAAYVFDQLPEKETEELLVRLGESPAMVQLIMSYADNLALKAIKAKASKKRKAPESVAKERVYCYEDPSQIPLQQDDTYDAEFVQALKEGKVDLKDPLMKLKKQRYDLDQDMFEALGEATQKEN